MVLCHTEQPSQRADLAASNEKASPFRLAAAAPLVKYAVNVTNTGQMDADDVVLGFLRPPGAGIDGVPLQSLYAFERVHVKAGATVTVALYPALSEFTQVDDAGERHELAGEYTFHFGPGGEHAGVGGMAYAEHRVNFI